MSGGDTTNWSEARTILSPPSLGVNEGAGNIEETQRSDPEREPEGTSLPGPGSR